MDLIKLNPEIEKELSQEVQLIRGFLKQEQRFEEKHNRILNKEVEFY